MNRRSFLKKLGVLAGLALVAPASLLELKKVPAITEGAIYGGVKARFNSKDFGVATVQTSDSVAARAWSKALYKETRANLHFNKIMGTGKDAILRII